MHLEYQCWGGGGQTPWSLRARLVAVLSAKVQRAHGSKNKVKRIEDEICFPHIYLSLTHTGWGKEGDRQTDRSDLYNLTAELKDTWAWPVHRQGLQ